MLVRVLLFLAALVGLAAVWTFSCVSKRFEQVAAGAVPLENRSFPRFTVVTVGSGGTFENHRRLGPAVVVARGERMVLVDAGRAVAQALRAAEIPVQQPEAVLLTSLLPENTLGLDDLLVGRSFAVEAPALRVIGPSGTRALVEGLLAAHASGLGPALAAGTAEPWSVEASEVAGDLRLEVAGLDAEAALLTEGPLPALVWRLEADGRAAVISSLGFAPEALVEHGRGADLWVHDALYGAALDAAIDFDALKPGALRREAAWHTRLEDVGVLASRMGVHTLVLTRLRPPPVFDRQYRALVKPSYRGRVLIAEDGLELTP
jgi:ribonuclease BN (tRNA processing enzyme)